MKCGQKWLHFFVLALFIIKITFKKMFETLFLQSGILIFILYAFYVCLLNDKYYNSLPESISATSYLFRDNFGTTWPFSFICFASAMFIFPQWMMVSPENYQFLGFLSCLGLSFAGTTPLYREKFERNIHYISGIVSFVCGLTWLILTGSWVSIAFIAVIGGLLTLLDKKNYVFFFEVTSYVVAALTLLLF